MLKPWKTCLACGACTLKLMHLFFPFFLFVWVKWYFPNFQWFPASVFGLWYAVLNTTLNVACSAGPVITAILSQHWDWRTSFTIYGRGLCHDLLSLKLLLSWIYKNDCDLNLTDIDPCLMVCWLINLHFAHLVVFSWILGVWNPPGFCCFQRWINFAWRTGMWEARYNKKKNIGCDPSCWCMKQECFAFSIQHCRPWWCLSYLYCCTNLNLSMCPLLVPGSRNSFASDELQTCTDNEHQWHIACGTLAHIKV